MTPNTDEETIPAIYNYGWKADLSKIIFWGDNQITIILKSFDTLRFKVFYYCYSDGDDDVDGDNHYYHNCYYFVWPGKTAFVSVHKFIPHLFRRSEQLSDREHLNMEQRSFSYPIVRLKQSSVNEAISRKFSRSRLNEKRLSCINQMPPRSVTVPWTNQIAIKLPFLIFVVVVAALFARNHFKVTENRLSRPNIPYFSDT